jgi:hypothetical protein
MATRLKLTKYVLVAATRKDDDLLRQSVEIQGKNTIMMVQVNSCEAILRYLDHLKKFPNEAVNEIWIFPDALGTRLPQFFGKALRYRSPASEILFVYAEVRAFMRKYESSTVWWLPTQSS